MMFCTKFPPSMTGIPTCAGVMMPAKAAASAVLAGKRRTCLMVKFLDVMSGCAAPACCFVGNRRR
jgi:hypothetical protein